MRIAAIGDPHGCIDEFAAMLQHLAWLSLDSIWVVGDYVDRGPDSGGLVSLCREKRIKGVKGNHDAVIVEQWNQRIRSPEWLPRSPDKARTLSQLCQADIDYLDALPRLHVFDELGLVLVHGGLWPGIPLYAQPLNVIRCQMLHAAHEGRTRWWGKDAVDSPEGQSEAANEAAGWVRWYKAYDHEQDVIFGHSVFGQPAIYKNEGFGATIGIDQGICFGGALTACIYDNNKAPFFITVKAKRIYFTDTKRSWWEV